MSTWTSKALTAAALMGLCACQPGAATKALSLIAPAAPIAVLDGALKVTGPRGYCPDPQTVQQADDSAVVLLGRCSADSTEQPAVVTVVVGRSGSGGVMAAGGAEVARFFASDTGRATLSRRGRAGDVTVGTALMSGKVFLMRIEDRREGVYWRGMIPLAGRLVSVSATGPDLPESRGRKLVENTAAALVRANR